MFLEGVSSLVLILWFHLLPCRFLVSSFSMDVVTTSHNIPSSHHTTPIRPILSKLSNDFDSKYDILSEIGRGGFSIVYQCQNRLTKQIYAVKAIDLRPLRLRENFDPKRLKREVDIMKGLHHPNIIQFQDVYENENHLLVVMEFAPGKELFDVSIIMFEFSVMRHWTGNS